MRTEPEAPSLAPCPDPLSGRKVLVLISGSIAAVKLPLLVSALVKRGAEVRCAVTPSAARLVSPVALASLSRNPCHGDEDGWSPAASRPLHVELAEWADLVLLAPLSATTLGRWVHGLGDTLVAAVLLACERPVLVAPAMNSAMWASPGVAANWRALQGWDRLLPLPPAGGLLACDRIGDGRMAEPERLLLGLESLASWGCRRDWLGRRLLVSAGPTREPLDPARCLTNPSTGLMGLCLAQAALMRGAEVDLVHGPLTAPAALLEGLHSHPILTAAELGVALQRLQAGASAIAMAAAVADHRRASPAAAKLPKQDLQASLGEGWEPVPDLLAELVVRRPPGQVILGFAACSDPDPALVRSKLERKGCDLLFANPIGTPEAGFAAPTNAGWLLGPGSRQVALARAPKLSIAHQLLSALGALLPDEGEEVRPPAVPRPQPPAPRPARAAAAP
ncbi:MAG: bifunctional phosphopantothenoylcysteine decarboxylase/phosphopantothenate--cysteine ligase CoaBC [Cyanobacteriota bacterium]|nr:bifunctional phosphopantothenoylcysteine decarboxylase/phosphopantothenate--cysteine ligase CoaBC [Cyanobacteriota bacterium]